MPRTSLPATLADALVTAREAACLTQEDLSERSGVSVRAIRNLETGHTSRPRKQSLLLIAKALGLPPDEIGRLMRRSGAERHQPPPGLVPAELPAAPRHRLVGRTTHLDSLRAYLSATEHGDTGRPAVVVGPPGAGKTSLVLEAAHGVRDRFPDGQVFVDLHPGASSTPLTPDEIVPRVLRSLGAGPAVDHPEEAAARLRDALNRRRVLVVLDNADSEAQIRPLLTDGSRSAVLVAARRELPALSDQFRRHIGVLSDQDALQVLEDLLGTERTDAERSAASSVLRFCGGLPLALHIAGLWLSARPHRSLRDLADRLTNEQDRLRFLHIGDLSLEASVAACYSSLPAPVRAALQRLRTVNGDFGVDAMVTHVTPSRGPAADLLDDLIDRQMVHWVGPAADGRLLYRLHDAVRQFVAYSPVRSWPPDRVADQIWLPRQAVDSGRTEAGSVRREA
ncbi:helix-turn-helix domain-containing protein [Streptomyces lanatus]|uniref:Helix-turn-helix domain-containing protein n=1 Tax=Streptomyces lanatus TaxID=66900 RepID=A0ABV1Y274_9ACTN|nr:helix-turn-helix domain-containing protein [Streptomyces lanatus]